MPVHQRGRSPRSSEGRESSFTSRIDASLNKGEVAGLSRQRTWTTIACFVVMGTFVALGHPGLTLMIFIIQVMMFKEAMQASRDASKERALPHLWVLHWMWFGTAVFLTYGRILRPQLRTLDFVRIFGYSFAELVDRFHSLASFGMYMVCFVALVVSLGLTTRRHRGVSANQLVHYQLSQFAYSQIALILIVGQSMFQIGNLFHGIVWWCVPSLLVIVNDITAYICGKWFGKTPLIVLSPKKTVEGFVGAIVLTMLTGVALSHYAAKSPMLVCSLYNTDGTSKGFNWTVPLAGGGAPTVDECDDEYTHSGLYTPMPAEALFPSLASLPAVRWLPWLSRFQLHTAVLALFASVIAPFGGFFASAVKRALGIKDWGDAIPGQGGFNDRFDCQLMMHAFVGVYHSAFVKQGATTIVSALLSMPPDQQRRALCAEAMQEMIAKHVGPEALRALGSYCP